jgi:hypothetical protein
MSGLIDRPRIENALKTGIMFRRSGFVVFAAMFTGASVWAQTPVPSSNYREIRIELPPGVRPQPGHGERLLMAGGHGTPQVVKLWCLLGKKAYVMLPGGEMKLVELSATKPTDEAFVPASQEQIIESLKASGYSKFKFKQEKNCVYAYDCSEDFFAHAHSIFESMRRGVADSLSNLGLKLTRPEVSLVVIILPNWAAYNAVHPMPRQVAAYYSAMTNQIVMYEDQEFFDAAPELALKQAAYVVAHEGVHQVLANVGVQKRLSNWPVWFTEGIAEYYCPLKVNTAMARKKNPELPMWNLKWTKAGMVNDLRMYSLLKMNAGSGAAIEKLVRANDIDANGYALAWGLVHYLTTQKTEEFKAYLADVATYQPSEPSLEDAAGKPDPLFVKHFGSDFAALEKEVQQYLTSKAMQKEYVDPVANQTQYFVKWNEVKARKSSGLGALTTSPSAAKKWKQQQAAIHKDAHFFTFVYKSKDEALRQTAKQGMKFAN